MRVDGAVVLARIHGVVRFNQEMFPTKWKTSSLYITRITTRGSNEEEEEKKEEEEEERRSFLGLYSFETV